MGSWARAGNAKPKDRRPIKIHLQRRSRISGTPSCLMAAVTTISGRFEQTRSTIDSLWIEQQSDSQQLNLGTDRLVFSTLGFLPNTV